MNISSTGSNSNPLAMALEIVLERPDRYGRSWCPARTGAFLRHSVFTRGRALSGLARQAVRLLRVMEAATPAGFAACLYGQVETLKADRFQAVLTADKLAGIAETTPEKIILIEQRMASAKGKPFDIGYVQMPLIGAYIDLCNNIFGFEQISEFAEWTTRPGSEDAETISRELAQAFRDSIAPHLESEHHQRIAKVIRQFAQAAGVSNAEGLDDEIIFRLWESEGVPEGGMDGFRLYRGTACHAISYRTALRTAEVELAATTRADSFEGEDEHGPLQERIASGDANSLENWVSPLSELVRPPADEVKWLTETDTDVLGMVLGDATEERAMFAGQYPVLALRRTILRYAVFGALQQIYIDRVKRSDSKVPEPTAAGYGAFSEALSKLQDKIRTLIAAVSFDLIRRRHVTGALLFSQIDNEGFQAFHRHAAPGLFDVNQLASKYADAVEAGGSPATAALKAAYRDVNRRGLRPQDRDEDFWTEPLAVGAEALPRLLEVLNQIVECVSTIDHSEAYAIDLERFVSAFDRIYR